MTLAILNELRIRNGKTELKSWKESKAKLAAAIDNEQGLMAANATNPKGNPSKQTVTEQLLKEEIARAAVVPAKKVNSVKHGEVATPKAIKAVRVGTVNVAAIAKELGINPKVARAKLRKANVNRADAAAIRKALTK